MSINIPWSDEDDQQLRSLAQSGFSLTEIAHRMRRNVSSVRSRALKITVAIARDRNPMQGPRKAPAALLRSVPREEPTPPNPQASPLRRLPPKLLHARISHSSDMQAWLMACLAACQCGLF
jgi:hypothetical protein